MVENLGYNATPCRALVPGTDYVGVGKPVSANVVPGGPQIEICRVVHIKDDGTFVALQFTDFQRYDPASDVGLGRTVKYFTQASAPDKSKWINVNPMPGGPSVYACLTGE